MRIKDPKFEQARYNFSIQRTATTKMNSQYTHIWCPDSVDCSLHRLPDCCQYTCISQLYCESRFAVPGFDYWLWFQLLDYDTTDYAVEIKLWWMNEQNVKYFSIKRERQWRRWIVRIFLIYRNETKIIEKRYKIELSLQSIFKVFDFLNWNLFVLNFILIKIFGFKRVIYLKKYKWIFYQV